ncbi:MAG TPA: hypothetical protein VLN46_07075 [Gillisia sp.]|nr:hypothetical protein [Gillisia sp.]
MKNRICILLITIAGLFFYGCSGTQRSTTPPPPVGDMSGMDHSTSTNVNSEVQELSDSPRHHEWVTLTSGDREFQDFVVYP